MFKKVNVKIIGIIENMSYFVSEGKKKFIFGKEKVKKESISQKIKFLGQIPLYSKISEHSDKGIPFLLKETRNSEITEIFSEISNVIIFETNKIISDRDKEVQIEIED